MPDSNPIRDYRETSSAKKTEGGGVLLDLSHEFDYIQWIAGALDVEYAVSKKISALEIDSDDYLTFSGRAKNSVHVQITLNYFTREPVRQIIIDGDGISMKGDLIANKLHLTLDNKKLMYSWPELDRNKTYRDMHRAILEDSLSSCCGFADGMETMHLISRVKSFSAI